MKGILYAEREELVSTDFKSHPGSSIFDLPSTMVVDGGRMAKTMPGTATSTATRAASRTSAS